MVCSLKAFAITLYLTALSTGVFTTKVASNERQFVITSTSSQNLNRILNRLNSQGRITSTVNGVKLSGFCNVCERNFEVPEFKCSNVYCDINVDSVERFVLDVLEVNDLRFLNDPTDEENFKIGEEGGNWIGVRKIVVE